MRDLAWHSSVQSLSQPGRFVFIIYLFFLDFLCCWPQERAPRFSWLCRGALAVFQPCTRQDAQARSSALPSPALRVFFQPCALGTWLLGNFLDVPQDKNLGQASVGSQLQRRKGGSNARPPLFARRFLIAGAEPVNPACKTWPRALSPFKVCPLVGVALGNNIPGAGARSPSPRVPPASRAAGTDAPERSFLGVKSLPAGTGGSTGGGLGMVGDGG